MMAGELDLIVEDGIGDLLTQLAGGERKRGQYLSDLVRGLAQTKGAPGADAQTLLFAVRGVTGQVQGLEGRLSMVETQLAAVIAKGQEQR
jgi:hypothetical protein